MKTMNPGSPAALYDHADQLLTIHESLLGDRRRNRPFYRALKKAVTPGCRVLDVGAGTGLWAIAAARLGAGTVVAVEREPLLAGLIKALARENGVADRIEVISGDARQLRLGKDFDVVVSETIGHILFDEEVIPLLIDARERFLKPGGVLIPSSVALRVAAARLRGRDRLPSGLPLSFALFESLLLHSPVSLRGRAGWRRLSEPADLIRVDLTAVGAPPGTADLTARWPGLDVRRVNCFAVWVEATLAAGVGIRTARTTSWSTTAYRIRPFRGERGDLEFKLTLTAETNYWTGTLSGGQTQQVQSYSPAQAAALLLAATRTDADVFRLGQGAGGTDAGR
jgi:SAM-dependent methyltransferase